MALTEDLKITQAIAPAAGVAAATDLNGATLDMSGFRGVAAVVTFGTIVATAVTAVKFQQGDLANLSDAADLAGTAVAVADDADETTVYVDLVAPSKRYVRVVVERDTANATVASALYLQAGPDVSPVVQLITGEVHASPAEGVA